MRPQLTAEVRTIQSEFTGNLRNIVRDIVHAVTRCNGLLVFGVSSGKLTAPLIHLDAARFLPAALDAVALQHQMTVVNTDITGKSVERDFAPPAYLDSGEVGRGI